jgi:hypothetical protein
MTLHLLFSHTLKPEQEADARQHLGGSRRLPLPPALHARWKEVPPEAETFDAHLVPFRDYLAEHSQPGDHLLIQGDFGMRYHLVQWTKAHGRVAVYATTRRESEELTRPDGSVERR